MPQIAQNLLCHMYAALFSTWTDLYSVRPTGPQIFRVHVVSTPLQYVFSGGRSSRIMILSVSGLDTVKSGC